MFVIFAMKDDNNLGAGDKVPLMLFFLIFGIGATLGWETGYAINLARDFGPRLFTYCVGYGTNVWKAGGKVPGVVADGADDDCRLLLLGPYDMPFYRRHIRRLPV